MKWPSVAGSEVPMLERSRRTPGHSSGMGWMVPVSLPEVCSAAPPPPLPGVDTPHTTEGGVAGRATPEAADWLPAYWSDPPGARGGGVPTRIQSGRSTWTGGREVILPFSSPQRVVGVHHRHQGRPVRQARPELLRMRGGEGQEGPDTSQNPNP